jgi:hypothetical protein
VPPATEDIAAFIGGFVAAEGTFVAADGGRRYTFAVGLGASDAAMCFALQSYLGCGGIFRYKRRKPHYDDECAFAIQSLRDHLRVTIPFMDDHLPVSHKREQYLRWRNQLLEYWEHDAKRVRPCTIEGCAAPRRAHQLCRHHLFAARGV